MFNCIYFTRSHVHWMRIDQSHTFTKTAPHVCLIYVLKCPDASFQSCWTNVHNCLTVLNFDFTFIPTHIHVQGTWSMLTNAHRLGVHRPHHTHVATSPDPNASEGLAIHTHTRPKSRILPLPVGPAKTGSPFPEPFLISGKLSQCRIPGSLGWWEQYI